MNCFGIRPRDQLLLLFSTFMLAGCQAEKAAFSFSPVSASNPSYRNAIIKQKQVVAATVPDVAKESLVSICNPKQRLDASVSLSPEVKAKQQSKLGIKKNARLAIHRMVASPLPKASIVKKQPLGEWDNFSATSFYWQLLRIPILIFALLVIIGVLTGISSLTSFSAVILGILLLPLVVLAIAEKLHNRQVMKR